MPVVFHFPVMASPDEVKLEHLAGVPLFSTCTQEELARIAGAAREIEVPAGAELCRHGDLGKEVFVLLAGVAAVKRYGRPVASLKPGSSFGELAVLTGLRRNATVIAIEDSTVLVLAQEDFATLLDSVPGLAHKLLATVAQRLYEADAKSLTH